MKKLLAAISLSLGLNSAFGAFTEFYVQTSGDNLNAGSTTNSTAVNTYAGGTFVRATGVFTVASGNPITDGVAIGSWASIYTTSGATVATFVSRVTGTNSTTITVSLAAIAGAAANVSETAAASTCKIGGAWAGPSLTTSFPFNFAVGTLTNSSGVSPRVNINAATYSVTNMTHSSNSGPIVFEGYTTTAGDGGRAVFDGGTVGTSFNILTVSGKNNTFKNLWFRNNGATGQNDNVAVNGSENMFWRCVFSDARGSGINLNAINVLLECEAFNCNLANNAAKGGFNPATAGCITVNCISHHNTNANATGFQIDTSQLFLNCISANNGASGFRTQGDVSQSFFNCSAYNNGGSGIEFATAGPITDPAVVTIMNCAFTKNTGAGVRINDSGGQYLSGAILNCAFGTGTETNSLGNFISTVGGASTDGSTILGWHVSGTMQLASGVNPWNAPTTGDFRNALAAIKGAGYGAFLQTYTNSTWTGTVAYPDIGSAQHQDSGSATYSVPFIGN